jgi:S1-C subfamily serine protease
MKKILAAMVISAALVSTAFADTKTYYRSGAWENYAGTSNKGVPICGMSIFTRDTSMSLHVKWSPDGVRLMAFKDSWRIPDGTDIPVEIGFDKNTWRSGTASGETVSNRRFTSGLVTVGINDDLVDDFLGEFGNANKIWMRFTSGNETPWVADMNGSRNAAAAFRKCISWMINKGYGAPPTQPYGDSDTTQPFDSTAPIVPKPVSPAATQPQQPRISSGSGFYVSAKSLVTNHHVVSGCSAILVGGKQSAAVSATDPADDLAVLSVPDGSIDAATLRVRPPPRTGESVVTFGFPLLDMLSSTGNATTGIVTSDAGLLNDSRHMQISTPIQHGNSGGPVLDLRGDVVGIVDSTIKPSAVQGGVPQNVNFAIKTAVLALFLDANKVAYNAAPDDKELAVPDVVERAKKFTVPVICYEGAPSQNVQEARREDTPRLPAPSGTDVLERRTTAFLNDLYRAVSSPNSKTLVFLTDAYAPSPIYFKESLSRQQVLEKILRFTERWPQRSYQINVGSLSVHCNDKDQTCEAYGVITYDARSPERRERSIGEATFEYTLRFSSASSAPKIEREDGHLVSRRKSSL